MAKKVTPRYSRKEELELEKTYRQIAGKKKKQKSRKGGFSVVLCLITLVALLGILAGCFAATDLEDGIIMDGVRIAGVDVGGMSKEEATTAIGPAVRRFSETNMALTVLDESLELTPELTEVSLDPQAAVEAAYQLGRSGSRSENKQLQLEALTSGIDTDLSGAMYINREAIVAKLNTLQIDTSSQLSQSGWELVGSKPDLTQEEVPEEAQTLKITMGTAEYEYDQEALVEQIIAAYYAGNFHVSYTCDLVKPDPIDLDKIYEEIYTEPVEPEIDPSTFDVSAHSYGYGFDLEAAKLALEEAEYGDILEIALTPIAPQQTKEGLASMLFRDTLSSHSAYYSSGYNRATNLRLACEALDGTILMPGETLSYNKTLGERTEEKGYLPAASYVGGKTEDTLGGGICQPSSVLYYCVLLADLEVVERYCHQYFCTYMDPGMDATVFWNGPDFKFRNNTDYPVRVDASANGGTVSIALIGTDTKDYYIDMEYEHLATYGWETKEKIVDPSEGYADGETITSPYTGYKYNTYKCKYSKDDHTLIERTFEAVSVYDKRDKVVAVYEEPETTEPKPTEPKPTDPPIVPDTPTEPAEPPVEPPVDPPVVPDEPVDPPPQDPGSDDSSSG